MQIYIVLEKQVGAWQRASRILQLVRFEVHLSMKVSPSQRHIRMQRDANTVPSIAYST